MRMEKGYSPFSALLPPGYATGRAPEALAIFMFLEGKIQHLINGHSSRRRIPDTGSDTVCHVRLTSVV